MDAITAGLAIWASTAVVSTVLERSAPPIRPAAATLTLRDAAARASVRDSASLVSHQQQPARVSRFSK